ncbi:hypothetical protein HDU77_008935 [Chytriomyces hyalinus]|nr:hypothetical protein HDU77_008935 [Chytriomyces hyalinus]
MDNNDKKQIRVAVIGSGLAGMSAAHLLSQTGGVDVTLFERNPGLGMDAGSIPVPCECADCVSDADTLDGQSEVSPFKVDSPHYNGRIDVPMRSFFPGYYPYLTSLYDALKIPYSQSDNSMSFFQMAIPPKDPTQLFNSPQSYPTKLDPINSNGNEKSELDQPRNVPQPSYFSFSCWKLPYPVNNFFGVPDLPPLQLLAQGKVGEYFKGCSNVVEVSRDYLRFLAYSVDLLDSGVIDQAKRGNGPLAGLTFGQIIKKLDYSDAFWSVFLPLFSGACTCTFEDLKAFPAHIILEYAAVCLPDDKMSFVTCGTKEVCARLASPVQNICYSTTVVGIEHNKATNQFTVTSVPTSEAHAPIHENAVAHIFDYVIFATQANQASRILSATQTGHSKESAANSLYTDFVSRATQILDKFPYTKSLVVIHTDPTLMPASRNEWRCLNFGVPSKHTKNHADTIGLHSSHENGYNADSLAMCTHYSQMTQTEVPGSVPPLFQTTNPIAIPDPASVISATWYERALVRLDTLEALRELEKVQGGGGGVYFVGSFVGDGIPLLESCVTSALDAAKGIIKDAFKDQHASRLYLPPGMIEKVELHAEKVRRRLEKGASKGERFYAVYFVLAVVFALFGVLAGLLIYLF